MQTYHHRFSDNSLFTLRADFSRTPATFECDTQLKPHQVREYREWLNLIVMPDMRAATEQRAKVLDPTAV